MTPAERTELVACMEAGTAARVGAADHGDNPYLAQLRGGDSPDSRMSMERISAWWDGWEEADKALSPTRVWNERPIYC